MSIAADLPDARSGAAQPPFAWPLRVYWEDTDAGGVVFYANYLRFFERARTEWLRALGFEQERMRRTGIEGDGGGAMFVVSATDVRYLAPARLDDALHITVTLIERGRASLLIEQQARRGEIVLAEGRIRIGCVHPESFKPIRIPASILNALDHPSA